MIADLVFASEVENDIAEAYAWYETQRPGLGEDFLSAVDTCINSLHSSPTIAQCVFGNYRRALLRRFPYAVIYQYQNGIVSVYGVFHTSRNPNKWRWRIS